jgi:solute carrier family 25 uncoupling protein 8/9
VACWAQVKAAIVGKDHVGDVPLLGKIAAGLATGAIAITVASPTDLVKVRQHSRGAHRWRRHVWLAKGMEAGA